MSKQVLQHFERWSAILYQFCIHFLWIHCVEKPMAKVVTKLHQQIFKLTLSLETFTPSRFRRILKVLLGFKRSTDSGILDSLQSCSSKTVPERIKPRLFDSSSLITSASHHMAAVLSVLLILHITRMFPSSPIVRCWDFTFLIVKDIGYFFLALDFKSWERNKVAGRVVVEELPILNAPW